MKYQNNFKVLFVVSGLLLFLSISISLSNYFVSLNSVKKELVSRSLPLSIDSIYTEIQSHLVEPSLISSMMANDTFVKEWLCNEEQDTDKIRSYLESIKNQYGVFVAFLVSEKTKKYYTNEGFLEKLDKDKKDNQWYFRFKASSENHEINLDYNANIDNSLILFLNYKIYDEKYHLIGATGIGHKISYIDQMLNHFQKDYKFKVCFVNREGQIVLIQKEQKNLKKLEDDQEWAKLKEDILTSSSKVYQYKRGGDEYLLKTKYIPEIHLYLLVEARVDDFIQNVNHAFYFNLALTLFVTGIIAILILTTIKTYNTKLTFMAQHDVLTQLFNRRYFQERLEHLHKLSERNSGALSLLFLDIDNFKSINDTYGHALGDEVLKRIAALLKKHVRQTDIVARWGGEEFVVGLVESDLRIGKQIADKLRLMIEEDAILAELVNGGVTASFGVAQCEANEPLDEVIARADTAMYQAKHDGKNRVIFLNSTL